MLSFRAQLVFVLTVLLLLFAIAAGIATVTTLEHALQEDGLRDARQVVDARRDQLISRIALSRQGAKALLDSVASNCDQSGSVNRACAADALGDWARREHVRYAVLTFPRTRAVQYGVPLPLDPALYRDGRGLNLSVAVRDAWSEGKLAAVFAGAAMEEVLRTPFQPGTAGAIGLLNTNGQPLVPMDVSPAALQALAGYCANESGSGAVRTGKQRILVAASALPGQGCVVAQVPVAELLQPSAVRLRQRFELIAAVFLALAAGLAFALAHLMSRPLTVLTKRVEAMRLGDFDSVVPRAGPSEIRAFADAFARMARSIKQSHETIQQSEEKLRLSYRAAHLWPWEASLTRGYFRWTDFGREKPVMREEPLQAVMERVHPDDRRFVQRTLEDTELAGSFQIEFRYTKEDGETIWIASRGERIQRITGPTLIGVNLDVTHRRRMEELKAERERLTASTRIAAELAHEVNNPLAAISGALYLMKGATPGTADYEHCLEIATEATNRITHIARQLLGLYQRSAGTAPVDVVTLMREVLDLFRAQANEQHVRLTADLPAEALLSGHAVELRAAIANLVANALTSIGLEGCVVVRVRQVKGRGLGRGGVRITVADSGAGIAPENLERVFEAFFSTSEQRGTGLGLWVTSNIIRRHYGSIRVRSSQQGPRRGTTVSIFLPQFGSQDALQLGPNRAA
ncbi:MAG: PAS domain-containing protein [Candidatus Koribacter versatilis]|uniref:histidine kinase n=1 Tax=Candidatus Korobacter versatilis TaxID=658062 RepID=A0A932EPB7_9BACT|nr:PAS domain-containing protein [Candidatus Koribacter versatilis]